MSKCSHRCANVSPALTALSQHWSDACGAGITRECDNSHAALTSVDGPTLLALPVTTTRCHSPKCHRVGEWVIGLLTHKPCHAYTFQRTGSQDHYFTDFGGPARLLVVLIDHNRINDKQCKLSKHFFTVGVTVFCSKNNNKLYP